ncbi:MAG: carbohydrate-binding module family 20 domain-containing protein [Myxococcota bacterium]
MSCRLENVVLVALLCTACATPLESATAAAEGSGETHAVALEDDALLQRESPMPSLPHAGGQGALTPWGGTNAARWRPEAILANAVSDALNRAWRVGNVADVVVAVPVQLLSSTFHEYGDGQSNAAVTFNAWSATRPPVVATLMRFHDDTTQVRLWLDASLPLSSSSITIQYEHEGMTYEDSLELGVASQGTRVTTWTPPRALSLGNPLNTQTVLLRPAGWADAFPLRFHFPVRPIAELKASVPSAWQRFSDGGDIVDHEGVSAQLHPGLVPFHRLLGRTMSAAYDPQPYTPASIHARFPSSQGEVVTGVGRGWTWVAHQPLAPFKIMYTCFEQRRADLEAQAPHGGVTSGAGWHLIGDPAETILHDLETEPVAVAFGTRNPWPESLLRSGGYAWGLSDVATFRLLRPGEAFVARRGGSLTDGNGTVWPQDNFHWFFFQQQRPVCTEEWVHPCVPGASLDFACEDVTVPITVHQASTFYGQEVRVVGNTDELGAWDPTRGVRLLPTAYPTWQGAVALPRGVTVEFKLVKVDEAGNVTWEGGGNRQLGVPLDGDVNIQGVWR